MRLGFDDSISRQKLRPGTARRILPFARPYLVPLAVLLALTALDAVFTASSPLILRLIIDDGILPRRPGVVVSLAAAIAVLAMLDAVANYLQARLSGRIGQGLVYDLRTRVFRHVQRQSLAFFTRTQTGSLVSRLNTDVIGAQQAVTSLLSQTLSAVLVLAMVLASMLYLSWQLAVAGLALIPFFLMPGRLIGRRLQRLARETMQLNADMGALMNERFNVCGAMLAKLYGRPDEEAATFAERAGRVRDVAAMTAVYGRLLFIAAATLTSLILALVYSFGGTLVIGGTLQIGTLVAMAALLMRLYGPINQLSSMQVNVMTALVSFDRVFEVLDLRPLVVEQASARELRVTVTGDDRCGGVGPDVEFDRVSFRYPQASEVSLGSLESVALPAAERPADSWVLRDVSFRAPAGRMTALAGPSGAGKTTIASLVPRLYDPVTGTVRIAGHDVRELTLGSLHGAVGVVTQDTSLFHDTIRANLLYARPAATEPDLIEACDAARIWELVSSLPDGLDTIVGDRGHRLSGGEKQRVAMARLLLKSPPIVVLDEATAHLDSESEAAIQDALRTALSGRTSLVIAHRLSTIRDADQILVVADGTICERGRHEELLAAGGLYAKLSRAHFGIDGRPTLTGGRA